MNKKLEELRLLSLHWNKLSDTAFEQIAMMRAVGCSDSLIEEAMLATGRTRMVAARIDELVGHLEATR